MLATLALERVCALLRCTPREALMQPRRELNNLLLLDTYRRQLGDGRG